MKWDEDKPGRPRKSFPRICKRGHDTQEEGFYLAKVKVKGKGKTYSYPLHKKCRRCRIEDVQNARKRKLMHKLPNRRPGFVQRITHINSAGSEDQLIITVNVEPSTDKVMEVFSANPMVGSDIEAILTDGCILISLCLQAGISFEELVHKLGDRRKQFEEPGLPTSIFGSIVRAAKAISDELEVEEKKK